MRDHPKPIQGRQAAWLSCVLAAQLLLACSPPRPQALPPQRLQLDRGGEQELAVDLKLPPASQLGLLGASGAPIPSLEVSLSGPQLGAPLLQRFTPDNYTEKLSLQFGGLPAGNVSISVRLVDPSGNTLASAVSPAVVVVGANNRVSLSCDPSIGAAQEARSHTEGLQSFVVDATSRAYAVCMDPNLSKAVPATSARLLRFSPNPAHTPELLNDSLRSGADLQLLDPKRLAIYADQIKIFDISRDPPRQVDEIPETLTYATAVLGKDHAGKLISFRGSLNQGALFQFHRESGTPYTRQVSIYQQEYPPVTQSQDFYNITCRRLAWDRYQDKNVPIWTCLLGIASLQDLEPPHEAPQLLLPVPEALGFCDTGPGSPFFLFTRVDDQNVYIWDRSRPNGYSAAFNLGQFYAFGEHNYPLDLERGEDGYYYLRAHIGRSGFNVGYWSFSPHFELLKLELIGRQLRYVQTISRSI